MPHLRRLATPALAAALGLGLSGCAMSFSTGCGLAASDPMTDGVARLSTGYHRHQAVATHQALQQKALMIGAPQGTHYRRPGQPVASSSALCFR